MDKGINGLTFGQLQVLVYCPNNGQTSVFERAFVSEPMLEHPCCCVCLVSSNLFFPSSVNSSLSHLLIWPESDQSFL
jgi:hypothetical protein